MVCSFFTNRVFVKCRSCSTFVSWFEEIHSGSLVTQERAILEACYNASIFLQTIFFNSVNIIYIIIVTPRLAKKKCLPFNISTL